MKKRNRRVWIYLLPLLLPFTIVVALNEYVRLTQPVHPVYYHNSVPAINARLNSITECSWQCYHNTTHCKKHHTSIFSPFFKQIDPFYFGMIKGLKDTGNYERANIIFLVLLWPLVMYALLVWTLKLYFGKPNSK